MTRVYTEDPGSRPHVKEGRPVILDRQAGEAREAGLRRQLARFGLPHAGAEAGAALRQRYGQTVEDAAPIEELTLWGEVVLERVGRVGVLHQVGAARPEHTADTAQRAERIGHVVDHVEGG